MNNQEISVRALLDWKINWDLGWKINWDLGWKINWDLGSLCEVQIGEAENTK